MRWLTRSVLTAAAVSLCQYASQVQVQVQAACTSGSSAVTGSPDPDALTLFVLAATQGGDFMGQYNGFGLASPPNPAQATTGLQGADNLCTYYASTSTFAKGSYNRNSGGGTVQFTALLSSSTVDAIDRFDATTASKNIQNAKGVCLGATLSDLFTGSINNGYIFDNNKFLTQTGANIGSNAFLWTGTGQFYAPGVGTTNANTRTAEKVGGRYHDPITSTGNTVVYNPTLHYCSDWQSADNTQSGSTGKINSGADFNGDWVEQSANEISCSSGNRIICLSAQPFQAPTAAPTTAAPTTAAPTSGGNGDPQFVGLQGQQFQVHGMPEEYFNLITTPTFQLNSRFTYLASGECHYNNTECWTHPGTYVDQIGFMFPGIQIKTVAGSHRKGLRVWINDEEMKKSSGKVVMSTTSGIPSNSTISGAGEVTVSHPHHDVLIVSSSLFTIEVTNSDWFFNFNLMFHSSEILESGRMMHYIGDAKHSSSNKLYPNYPMHGLVGQTWKNARYPAKRMYQGEVDDYMLLDHTLFSTQFLFNLYAY